MAGLGSPQTERKNCFYLEILDDELHEGRESLILSTDPHEPPRVILQPNITEVFILNDDSEFLTCEL